LADTVGLDQKECNVATVIIHKLLKRPSDHSQKIPRPVFTVAMVEYFGLCDAKDRSSRFFVGHFLQLGATMIVLNEKM
jgi:hypothetical protein